MSIPQPRLSLSGGSQGIAEASFAAFVEEGSGRGDPEAFADFEVGEADRNAVPGGDRQRGREERPGPRGWQGPGCSDAEDYLHAVRFGIFGSARGKNRSRRSPMTR